MSMILNRSEAEQAADRARIGASLHAARKARDLSPLQAAEAIGALTAERVPGVRYVNWEKGLRRIPLVLVAPVAQALGLTLNELWVPEYGPLPAAKKSALKRSDVTEPDAAQELKR